MDDLERIQVDGLTIIKPKNTKKVPLDCPVCSVAFSSIEDILSYKMNGCCSNCNLDFRLPNIEKWNSGWRPNL